MTTPPRDRLPVRVTVATLAALALGIVLSVLLSACTVATPTWKTDDLLRDQATGRYFTTCEDPYDDNHEREVYLSDEAAATHAEGQDCPTGEIRRADYYETDEDDRKAKAKRVTKPTSGSSTRATPAPAAPTSTTGTTTTTPARTATTSTTTRATTTTTRASTRR